MATVIELSSLHAFLCTRDKQRAKQFKRMRKANMKARKKKNCLRGNADSSKIKMYNFASLL